MKRLLSIFVNWGESMKAIWNRRNINTGTVQRIACTVIAKTCAGRVAIIAHMPYGDVMRYVHPSKIEKVK